MDSSFPVVSHAYRSSVLPSRSHASSLSLLARFTHPRERFVFEGRDFDRDGCLVGDLRCLGVEIFAKRHDVESSLSQGRSNGRRRLRLPRWNQQSDAHGHFFRRHRATTRPRPRVCVCRQLSPKGPFFQSNPCHPRETELSSLSIGRPTRANWKRRLDGCFSGRVAAVLPCQVGKGL